MLRSPLLLDLIVVAAGIGNEIVFKKDCLIPFFEVKTSLSAVPVTASTLEQCQSKCQAESECKAFTFIPSASQCKLSDSTDLQATLTPADLVSWAGDCDCSANSVSSVGLQCWAKKEGVYLKQCTVKALQSTATSGWKGNCEGLEVQTLGAGQDCKTACVENPLCSTWQSVPPNITNAKPNCYAGAGFNCDADRQGHDMAAASERLQHGEIKVIESLTTQQVIGLESHSNLGVDACREICYSDLFCQHWQFFDQARTEHKKGCWVESKKKRANYPAQVADISDAESISAGEFIQHWCGTDTTTTTTTTTTTLFQLTQVENGNLKVGDRVFIPAKTLICLLECPTAAPTTTTTVVTEMVVVTDTPLVVTEVVTVTHTVPVTEMISVTAEPLVVTEVVTVTHTVPVTEMVSVTDEPLVVTEVVTVTHTVPVTEMVSVTADPLVVTETVSVTHTVPVTEMVSVTAVPLVVTEKVSVTYTVPVNHTEAVVVTAAPSTTSAAAIARRLAEEDDTVKFVSSVRELKCPLADGDRLPMEDGTWGQITAVDEQHGVFSIKLESPDSRCVAAKPEDLSLIKITGGKVSGGQVSGGKVSVSDAGTADQSSQSTQTQTVTPPPDHTWPLILIGLAILCCAILVCFLYTCRKNEDPPTPKKKTKRAATQDPEPIAVQTVPHYLLAAPAVQYVAAPSMSLVAPMVTHPTSLAAPVTYASAPATYASAPVAYASAPAAGSYQFAGAQPTAVSYPAGSPAAYA